MNWGEMYNERLWTIIFTIVDEFLRCKLTVGDNVVLFVFLRYAQYWGQIINKKHQLKLFLLFLKLPLLF